jgi:hypothetical protein
MVTISTIDATEGVNPVSRPKINGNFDNLKTDLEALESVAATKTGIETLTNKTLTTPTINNPTVTTGTLTSPTLVTPVLGTPASGTLTNCSGTAANLTAGAVTATWTTANPTFDVATFDNGTGEQPTITYARYIQIGKFVTVQFKVSGYKVGTDTIIKTTAWSLPTEATITSGQIVGTAGYEVSDTYITINMIVYRSSGVWWICKDAGWLDNTNMTDGLSGTFSYEAA